MAGPFVDTSKKIAAKLGVLDNVKRAELFAAASRALFPAYIAWANSEGIEPESSLHRAALSCIRDYAQDDPEYDPSELLATVPKIQPEDLHDADWFLEAQDCWILLTQAMQCLAENDDGNQGAWFLLEPVFQSTCQRLFGFTEADSDEEELVESKALTDRRLHSAITSVNNAIDDLSSDKTTPDSIDLTMLNPMN